jgi:hypothetical protein
MKESSEMDAWTDLNQSVVRDRIRERTDAAAADRRADAARAASNANRIVEPRIHWFELVNRRDQAQSKPDAFRRNFEAVLSL